MTSVVSAGDCRRLHVGRCRSRRLEPECPADVGEQAEGGGFVHAARKHVGPAAPRVLADEA